MGLLDQIMGGGGGPQRRPGLGSTLAAGAVLALLVKGVRQYQASHGGQPREARSFDPNAPAAQPQAAGEPGGLLSALGGLGGGGLSDLIGGLGGAGALGALINRFQEKGYGDQVSSWLGQGENQPIAPHEVANALGETAINELQQKSGMPRDQLLAELARELPHAISAATPQGRAPRTDQELHEAGQQSGAGA